MSYIGNEPTTVAFLTDTFSGNGSTVAFTMQVAPATTTSVLVAVTGVVQDPSTYSVVGTTLTFSQAPPTGTSNISVRYLGIPASGVTTTAYRTVTDFTATAGQTTFSVPSYTVGYIDVYRNGVRLAAADYTATNGTTVVLVNAATLNDSVVTESFYVSSVLNAIPATAGAVNTTYIADNAITTAKIAPGAVIPADLSTGAPAWDASGNVGIGTSSPSTYNSLLVVAGSSADTAGTASFVNDSATATNATERKGLLAQGGATAFGVSTWVNSFILEGQANGGVSIGSYNASGAIKFYTNTSRAERARIDSSGALLVNRTSGIYSTTKFEVKGAASQVAACLQIGSDGFAAWSWRNAAGSEVGYISINSGSTNYATSSDYRLKHDIAPMTGALAKVAQLKPVTYKWNSDNSESQGFIAHELQAVVPECVTGEKDAVDADGNPQYQGIDTSFLVATLTAAIQEQQAIITALTARVLALEGA
jgi:hypothetical protein